MLHEKTLANMSVKTLDKMLEALEDDINEHASIDITRESDGTIIIEDRKVDTVLELFNYNSEVSWFFFEETIRAWIDGNKNTLFNNNFEVYFRDGVKVDSFCGYTLHQAYNILMEHKAKNN